MCELSDPTGSNSDSETSGEIGNPTDAYSGEIYYEKLIKKANKSPLLLIFKYYGLRLDYNGKSICPFKSHKNGREGSPSFKFYSDTNSFYCYGCGIGGKFAHATEFISYMEGISKINAAYKVLEIVKNIDDFENQDYNDDNVSEKLSILLEFSNHVRLFRRNFSDEASEIYIENICDKFDNFNLKNKLSNEGLKILISKLILMIDNYLPTITI